MKQVAIIIFCETAVGKYTVAKQLAELLEIKLSHNHLSYDLVYSLFKRGSERAAYLIEPMRFDPYVEAAKEGISFVTTQAYSYDYVSPTGLSDPEYLLKLERSLQNAGAEVHFVYLQASDEEIMERVTGESRKEHGKLTNEIVMRQILC